MHTSTESKNKDFKPLIDELGAFTNTIYSVKEKFDLLPDRKHISSFIEYSDLLEMREEFLNELINSIIDYAYSKQKQNELLETFGAKRSKPAAFRNLYGKAKSYFNIDDLQGDFSEILLYNLMQVHFKAVPVVRKVPITTNEKLARNGSDAMHLTKKGNKYYIYLGEAKTYGGLKPGLKKATSDIVFKHYKKHRDELNMYLYEYLPKEVEEIVESYLNGELKNVEVHFVCLISFDINEVDGSSRKEKIDKIIKEVKANSSDIKKSVLFTRVPKELLPRINYILFPIQKMKDLIRKFEEMF